MPWQRLLYFPPALPPLLGALLPAQADNFKKYVSSTGSATTCDFTTPCADFQHAHDAIVGGRQIACLNSGDFAAVTITKSITIDCAGTLANVNSVVVNGAGIVVTIRSLAPFDTDNGIGIDFQNGAALFVENCTIRTENAAPAYGIRFAPSTAGAELVVSNNTIIKNNSTSNGLSGGGTQVKPTGSGSALVSLDHVTVADNVFGIVADGSGSTAGIAMVVANSTVHHNTQDGIVATTVSGDAPIGLTVKDTRSLSNNIGIRATGPGVTVRADSATVMHNGTGLVFNNGGALLSFGNNNVEANGVNGAFSGPATWK